jgi:D-alanyl-D-alanine endopeptidase (penicillin-binding protein 7)
MIMGVVRLRKILLGIAISAGLTGLAVPTATHAATSASKVAKAKKTTSAQTTAKRKTVVVRKSQAKVAKAPVRKTVKAASARNARVKVQMAGGRTTSLHKVSIKQKPAARSNVVRAAIVHRPSMGEALGLRGNDDPLELNSSVALVIDQQTNEVLFSKNDSAVLPIASLTKLMTGLVVADAGLDMNELITITGDDIDTVKGSRSRLAVGTTLSRGEMMHLALMSSENRAANALGRTYPGGLQEFVRLMNQKAATLGMADTRYVEPTGLSSLNQSSARDLATLVSVAYQRPILRSLSTSPGYEVELGRRTLHYNNSNRLIKNPDWDIGLQKTGYISEAGRCLVMQAKVAGRQLIMVFLDSAGKVSRMQDAERVRRWVEVQTGATQPLARHQPQG